MSTRQVLQITVPRLSETGALASEQILAALHGLLSKALKNNIDETISLEIAKARGRIFFYVTAPAHLITLVKSQIYAQYPRSHISIVPDYLTEENLKGKSILCAEMGLRNLEVCPIKRHPQFVDPTSMTFNDPLATITSSLESLYAKDNIASIQMTVRPIRPDWNRVAQDVAKKYFQGGLWQYEWFQNMYHWARCDHNKGTRVWRFWAWGLVNLMFGKMGKNAAPSGGGDSGITYEDDDLDRQSQTSHRHDRETPYSSIFDSMSRLQYATQVRMLYVHSDPDKLHAEAKMRELLGTFKQFSLARSNGFVISKFTRKSDSKLFSAFKNRTLDRGYAMSGEELATIWHLPLLSVNSPSIQWVESATLEPPVDLPDYTTEDEITAIGKTNFRGALRPFGLRVKDRRRHVYVIGKTGMGKSTLLLNMMHSDIDMGRGIGVIDPHGDLVDDILRRIPPSRTNDVIYIDPADAAHPIALNVLEMPPGQTASNVAGGIVSVFKKLHADSWGPRLEHFLRNIVLTMLDVQGQSLLGVLRILSDKGYRNRISKQVKDPMLAQFWEGEFNKLDPRKLAEAVGPIQNKVGQFLSAPMVRNIVGQNKSTVNIRKAMDEGKIILVKLSKGMIGEDNAAMLGSLLVTKFQIDAMSRSNIPQDQRRDFSLYVDEFQNFATESFATILSEARKYRLWLTMANQYIEQMSEEVAAAVFGNVGSLMAFQVGYSDGEFLSKQLNEERVTPEDLTNLPKYTIYTRLLVDGMPSPVFSADTLPPSPESENADVRVEKILKSARHRYSKGVEKVEQDIYNWMLPPGAKGTTTNAKEVDAPVEKGSKPSAKTKPKGGTAQTKKEGKQPVKQEPKASEKKKNATAKTPKEPAQTGTEKGGNK